MSEEIIEEKEEVKVDLLTSISMEIDSLKKQLEDAKKVNEATMKMVNDVMETNKRLVGMLNSKPEGEPSEPEKSDMEVAEEAFREKIKEGI